MQIADLNNQLNKLIMRPFLNVSLIINFIYFMTKYNKKILTTLLNKEEIQSKMQIDHPRNQFYLKK